MSKKFILITYTILFLAFCLNNGCNSSDKNSRYKGFEKVIKEENIKILPSGSTTQSLINVAFPGNDSSYFDYKKHLTDLRYIPLEKTQLSVINNIDRIFCSSSRIVIVDKRVTECVYVFDANGRFINRISAKKKLGEFRTNDFGHFFCAVYIPSDKEIILYDDQKDKFYYFNEDGQYKSDQPAYLGFSDFVNLGGTDNLVYLSLYSYNNHLPLLTNYDLYIGKKGALIDKVAINNKTSTRIDGEFYYDFNLSSSGRHVFYTPVFSDTVYEIKQDLSSVVAKFRLNFPGETINEQVRGNGKMNVRKLAKLQNTRKFYDFEGKVLAANDICYFECYKGGKLGYFYSVKSNRIVGGQIKSFSSKTDSATVEGYNFPIASTGNEFISIMEPANFALIPNVLRTQKLSNVLKNFNQNSNPIVMFYKINNLN